MLLNQNKIYIFDGAAGTTLSGFLKNAMPPEYLNVENPSAVIKMHEQYIECGADIVKTNSFGGNAYKLKKYGLENKLRELNAKAVENAVKAKANSKILIAGSTGPTGELPQPMGAGDFEFYRNSYYSQIKTLIESGADIILLETFSSLFELKAAFLTVKEINKNTPVFISVTYTNGKTIFGTKPEIFARAFDYLGAEAIGSNCIAGAKEIENVCNEYYRNTNKNIFIMPNAGIPYFENGKAVYPENEETFAYNTVCASHARANILGGCCGAEYGHIKKLKAAAADLKPLPKCAKTLEFACSDRYIEYHDGSRNYFETETDAEKAVDYGLENTGECIIVNCKKDNNIAEFIKDFQTYCQNPLIFRNAGAEQKDLILKNYNGIAKHI